jgi:PAS domain S-box-containing protein
MSFSLRGVAWAAFAVAVVLLIGSSVLLYRATNRQRAIDSLVSHTHEVQTVIEDLGSQAFEATNSRRAFIITGNESLLAGYHSAVQNVPQYLARLRQLTSDSPERQRELDAIQADIEKELALIASSLSAGMRGTSSSDREIRVTLQTAEIGSRVQQALQRMRSEEDELLRQRQEAAHNNYERTLHLITTSFVIAMVLLLAQMILLSYQFTQHERTETVARQSQEIVDAFFSSSTVGFVILDSHFRCTRFNEAFPRMAGLEPEQLPGKTASEIFRERGLHSDLLLGEVLRTGKPVLDREVSAELPAKPGETRCWLVNYFPIREDGGVFTQLGIIVVDVTARRNAEEALRKLSGRLLGIQDQERRRIARELHDSLGQYLVGLKIAIEMLGQSPGEANAALLAECKDILDKSITETRTLSHLLHPPLLDEAGFASAASWFVTGFSQRSGIPVTLEVPPDLPRLPESVEIALFRILQESLTNVHRHSRAPSAEIRVEADAEQVSIEVRDHGRGIPGYILRHVDGEGAKLGVGLAGMRERIHELGGVFEVLSDESGTTVRAVVPLNIREETFPLHAGAGGSGG